MRTHRPAALRTTVVALLVTLVAMGGLGTPATAAVNSDGSLDPDFGAPSPNNFVSCVLALANGKLLLGGTFTNYGGNAARDHLVRLNADGSVDNTFSPPALSGGVSNIVVDAAGRILLGGDFQDVGGVAGIDKVARLKSDGSLDRTFVPVALGVRPFAIYPTVGGDVYLGGMFVNVGGNQALDSLIRVHADGSLDGGFTPPILQGDGKVIDIAPGRAGGITIGGTFDNAGGWQAHDKLARVTSTGAMDATFTPPSLNDAVYNIESLPNGQIAIGGSFTQVNGFATISHLARINQNGSLDNTFVPPVFSNGVQDMVVTQDGKVVFVGWFLAADGSPSIARVARANSDGTLDRTFVPPATSDTFPLTVTEAIDGKIVVGGMFTAVARNQARNYLMRLGYTEAGPAVFDPGVASFGSVVTGSSKSLNLTVRNSGRADLTPTALTPGTPDLEVVGGSCASGRTIASGNTCTVELTWSPRTDGVLEGPALRLDYRRGVRGQTVTTTDTVPATGRANAAGDPGSAPGSTPGAGPGDGGQDEQAVTSLNVKALTAKRRLTRGRSATVVRSVTTNGSVTERTVACYRKGKKAARACTVKRKRSGKIRITPLCTTGVVARVSITATAPQSNPSTWTRSWKVRKSPRKAC